MPRHRTEAPFDTSHSELGNVQLDITSLGRQQPRSAAVAVGGPAGAALVAVGADLLGGLGIDQRLQHQPERFTDDVQATAGAQRCKQVGHGRLVKGHRGELLGVNLGGNTLSFTRWPSPCYSAGQGPVLKVHHFLGRLPVGCHGGLV
jgi:hypothetical protein